MDQVFKIGVWAPERKLIVDEGDGRDGGAYYYTNKLYKILLSHKFKEDISIVFIGYEINDQNYPVETLSLTPLHKKISQRILLSICVRIPFIGRNIADKIRARQKNNCIDLIKKQNIDLIYYPKPGIEFIDFPFIATHWDTGHLSSYALPELTMHGNFESRDYYHGTVLQKALLVCCESVTGKEETVNFLRINPKRIEILPLFPGEVIESHVQPAPIASLQGKRFFFYPATYSSHKNHYNLLQAFSIFSGKYPDVQLVLTGDPLDNKTYINQCIDELDLNSNVFQLGVVSVRELKWLYQNAISLVMPTLLGPTNMPLLEAFYLNCRVLCTDMPGHREQIGEYGNYFDALDKESILHKLEEVYDDELNGKKPPSHNSIKDDEIFIKVYQSLERIFSKARILRKTWGKNDRAFKQ